MSGQTRPQAAQMHPLGHVAAESWRVSADRVDVSRPAPPVRPLRIDAEPQAVTADLHKTAVVVVDMQNDFCSPGGWLSHIGVDVGPAAAIVPALDAALGRLRAAGVPVVWVNWGNRPDRLNLSPSLLHVYNPDGASVGLGDPVPATGAPVLEKGSWGAAIVDGLATAEGDIHVDKYRMSGFWDTPLDSMLRQLGVRTLLFAGVNVDQCVLHTLADANFLGYDCVLLTDCTATTSPAFCWDATVYNVRQIFGFTAESTGLEPADGEGA